MSYGVRCRDCKWCGEIDNGYTMCTHEGATERTDVNLTSLCRWYEAKKKKLSDGLVGVRPQENYTYGIDWTANAKIEKYKSKGKKMKTLVKVLRRGIMLWVLYGGVRLAMLVNPFVRQFGVRFVSEDCTLDGANVLTWILLILGILLLYVTSYAFHKFSAWIFNEGGK